MSDAEKLERYAAALREIAERDWPVNLHGTSPQKIAAQALKE